MNRDSLPADQEACNYVRPTDRASRCILPAGHRGFHQYDEQPTSKEQLYAVIEDEKGPEPYSRKQWSAVDEMLRALLHSAAAEIERLRALLEEVYQSRDGLLSIGLAYRIGSVLGPVTEIRPADEKIERPILASGYQYHDGKAYCVICAQPVRVAENENRSCRGDRAEQIQGDAGAVTRTSLETSECPRCKAADALNLKAILACGACGCTSFVGTTRQLQCSRCGTAVETSL